VVAKSLVHMIWANLTSAQSKLHMSELYDENQ
jgi:hypothetical protein